MKHIFFFVLGLSLLILKTTTMATEASSVWSDVASPLNQAKVAMPPVRWLTLDTPRFLNQLNSAADEKNSSLFGKQTSVIIALPLPTGDTVMVRVIKSPIMEAALAEKYPKIQTWKVYGTANTIISGRLDITPAGFHAILSLTNGETIVIDPVTRQGKSYYLTQRHLSKATVSPQCQLQSDPLKKKSSEYLPPRLEKSIGDSLQTYRLAVAATGQYTQFFGGTVERGLAAVVTTINRVNEIYERDLAIRFVLIGENNQIIYTDSTNDPYNYDSSNEAAEQNQINLDRVIGTANYDIGHLFGRTGGGGGDGIAILASACKNDIKGTATTSLNSPQGDIFSIDFVSHELGHQLGAEHTFNGNQQACASRDSSLGYEPGSGSTIMAYAGICGDDNLQLQSDAVFHSASLQQITYYSREDVEGSCAKTTLLNNSPPVVNAGNNYIIPARTPFLLSVSATDTNNDSLTYAWDQMDSGSASAPDLDTGNNAIIRSYLPSSASQRSIPNLVDLLAGTQTKGEMLATTSRILKFNVVVRDGKGGVAMDGVGLQVHDTGSEFSLTEPTTSISIERNQNLLVRWNIANTDASPINCGSVDIALSTDEGGRFILLSRQTRNDGSETVRIPANAAETSTARLKISCHNNIFFAVSPVNFIISGIVDKPSETEAIGSLNILQLLFLFLLLRLFQANKYINYPFK